MPAGMVDTAQELDAEPVTIDGVRKETAVYAGWVFLSTAIWFGPFLAGALILLVGERWNWWRVLIAGVVYGAGMALTQAWQARRSGALRARQAMGRDVATGTLPPDTEAVEWGAVLSSERDQLMRDLRALPTLLGVTAVLVAAVAATTDDTAWSLWLYAAVAGVCAAAAPSHVRRRLHAVERRLEQLDQVRPSS